jgi:hypothetical protein
LFFLVNQSVAGSSFSERERKKEKERERVKERERERERERDDMRTLANQYARKTG